MSLRRNARTSLNEGWRFRFSGDAGTSELVSLPHSWNALDTMETDPARHYRRAVGVDQRMLPAQSLLSGERLWIEFEAASQKARVELNGRLVAEHLGGYTAFAVDIGRPDEDSDLIVRVHNRHDPDLIPSDLSDFFLYGGLTRNAWLYKTGPARIAAAWIDAEFKSGIASLTARGRLEGDLKRGARLVVELRDPDGVVVTQKAVSVRSPEFAANLGTILGPRLWSPARPDLYCASFRLDIDDQLSDQVEVSAGLRWFRFSAGGLLQLNGQPLGLHGTHRHEDWAGYGSVVPDDLTRREMKLIREAGFNFGKRSAPQ